MSSSLLTLQNQEITDWKLCCICQIKTPNNNLTTQNKSLITYTQLTERLTRLESLHALPSSLKSLKRLNEGDGICKTLLKHNATWHKSCFNLCNEQKIKRAEKRKSTTNNDISFEPSVRKKSRTSQDHCAKLVSCFFAIKLAVNFTK